MARAVILKRVLHHGMQRASLNLNFARVRSGDFPALFHSCRACAHPTRLLCRRFVDFNRKQKLAESTVAVQLLCEVLLRHVHGNCKP